MLALLFASAEAIKIKSEPLEPLDNTCLYVRKDTGIEQPCNAPGNSAWEPDVPLQSAAEMGLSPGYLGSYWFMPGYTGSEGYDLGGIEPSVKDMVTKEIMFDNAKDMGEVGIDSTYGYGQLDVKKVFNPTGELSSVSLSSNGSMRKGRKIESQEFKTTNRILSNSIKNVTLPVLDEYGRLFNKNAIE